MDKTTDSKKAVPEIGLPKKMPQETTDAPPPPDAPKPAGSNSVARGILDFNGFLGSLATEGRTVLEELAL